MNIESILMQFEKVENSLKRAKLPFETNMIHDKVLEVSLWELMRSYKQIENMIREIDERRFGIRTVRETYTPKIDENMLFLCTICGNPDCESDHK